MDLTAIAYVEIVYFFETPTFNFLATLFRNGGKNSPLECEYRFRYFRQSEKDEKNFYHVQAKPGMDQVLRDTIHKIATQGSAMYDRHLEVIEINGSTAKFAERVKTLPFMQAKVEQSQ